MATIFHIALASEWAAARQTGAYTTSTRGRTLAEEGFIHASRGDQWTEVRERFYADLDEPLVLLHIDTDLLDVPVVEEPAVPGGAETFPHIYGRLPASAVVKAIPLSALAPAQAPAAPPPSAIATVPATASGQATAEGTSFARVYFREMFFNVGLLTLAMAFALVGALVGRLGADDGRVGIFGLVGLVIGGVVAAILFRRRHAPR